MRRTVPIDLSEDEARELLLTELGTAEYQNAKPTLIDQAGQAIGDWFAALFSGEGPQAPPAVPFLIALGLVALLITVALLIYGVPRRNRRAAALGGLFGEEERRAASTIRADARAAARRGDWPLAITEAYRAIARALAERELVTTLPGTTAREFAVLATRPFPAEAVALQSAASAFDEVRYLGHPGSRAQYDEVSALDAHLQGARPLLPEPASPAAVGAPK